MSPEIKAFVITPICPHTISNRPIVIEATKKLRIEYTSSSDPIEMVIDGLHRLDVHAHESLLLEKSAKSFRIVHLHRIDYFATLRTKLSWSGKLR